MKKSKYVLDAAMFSVLILLVSAVIWFSLKKEELPERLQNIDDMQKGEWDFSFWGIDKKDYRLMDFRGKTVLINIWATWCLPCVEELPSLMQLAEFFPDKLMIIAVTEEDMSVVQDFMKQFSKPGKNFIVGISGEVLKVFAPRALPESYLLDQEGKLLEKILGPRLWDSLEWKNKIDQIITSSNSP